MGSISIVLILSIVAMSGLFKSVLWITIVSVNTFLKILSGKRNIVKPKI